MRPTIFNCMDWPLTNTSTGTVAHIKFWSSARPFTCNRVGICSFYYITSIRVLLPPLLGLLSFHPVSLQDVVPLSLISQRTHQDSHVTSLTTPSRHTEAITSLFYRFHMSWFDLLWGRGEVVHAAAFDIPASGHCIVLWPVGDMFLSLLLVKLN